MVIPGFDRKVRLGGPGPREKGEEAEVRVNVVVPSMPEGENQWLFPAQKGENQAWFHGGLETCRSPPVSF